MSKFFKPFVFWYTQSEMHSQNKGLYLLQLLTLFIIYFLTAKLGLSLEAVSGFATLVWLPSGISLTALLIFGIRLWPAITLGALLINLSFGASLPSAIGIAIGNTLEPVVGAYLLRYFHFRLSLPRLKDVLSLVLVAGILSPILSATIGVVSLTLGGTLYNADLVSTWVAWWVGDMISNLIVAPLILVLVSTRKIRFKIKYVIEISIIAFLLFLVYLISFSGFLDLSVTNNPMAYLVFPPLIWTALRFGQRGATIISAILAVLATISTLQGHGPFLSNNPQERLIFLQMFMAVTSVSTMILAAVMTERKQTEKIKNEFISIATHELKTPITTLKGYTQLLQQHLQKNKDTKGYKYASHMITPVNYISKLISDLFDESKIETGKMKLEKEWFDMHKLVSEVIVDMKHLNPTYTFDIASFGKTEIYADKYRIGQVLNNLISNAIKFSPKNHTIRISISSNKQSVLVNVQDWGIGISEKNIDNVFERFFQADTRIRQSIAGLGLGLYISSDIIKHHGGKIWVKSKKLAGSTFSFSVPKYKT